MKNLFRFTIGKKVFLLTAALSIALILVSITIASSVFSRRKQNDAKLLCEVSAEVLSEYLSSYEMLVSGSGTQAPFLTYYIERLDALYRENYDEIEEMSYKVLNSEEDFTAKKAYFDDLTATLFTGGGGFGVSYDMLSFRTAYKDVIEEMERMASVEGMLYCAVYYYDAEHETCVFLCDSSSESSWFHYFPGSINFAPEYFKENILPQDDVTVVSDSEEFASYMPIRIDGKTVAFASFDYSIDRLADAQHEFMRTLLWIMLIATVVILILCLFVADRWLVKNVKKLSDAARTFTVHMNEGQIKPICAKIKTHDEIMDLSDDFFALQNRVIDYSEDIARKRAKEERMQAELGIASKIQMQSLPDKPIVAESARVSSFIKPAKEVGGDLFDYFLTNDGKLFFVIADVSGKGVPAALFMMRGKEIIRSCAKAGMSAGKIAQTANAELCKNNKEGLFITAFIGIYDGKNHLLTYARAGHEQPFLLRGGKAEKFGEESNFVLGAFDDMPFAEDSLVLKDGDRILLYTDGLNEGINKQDKEFGYERIKEVLESADGDLLATLYESALAFANGTEQFDDITMLLFECVKSRSFTLNAPTYDDIPTVTDQINEFVKGFDGDKTAELDVIIDELMNNYISYAFDGVKKPRLTIEVTLTGGVAQLTFTDNGVLFDPLRTEAPDVESDLMDRKEGGMGIMIAKTVADRMSYRVFEGQNHLTITKSLI